MNMATKCMSIDMKADNIVTLSICPSFVATDLTEPVRAGGVGGKSMDIMDSCMMIPGAITPEDSIKVMLDFMDTVNETHSGRFFNSRTGLDYKW